MTDDDEDKRAYAVGRGKPPTHSRFKPGRSGNPKGRPKGSKNHFATILAVANEKHVVMVKGKRRTMTTFEAVVTKRAHQALAGDQRSGDSFIKQVLQAYQAEAAAKQATSATQAEATSQNFGTEEDEQILDTVLQRLKEKQS